MSHDEPGRPAASCHRSRLLIPCLLLLAAAVGLMWEDAVMQPPGAPRVEGHEAIRALYESVIFESLDPGPLTGRGG